MAEANTTETTLSELAQRLNSAAATLAGVDAILRRIANTGEDEPGTSDSLFLVADVAGRLNSEISNMALLCGTRELHHG